MRLALLGRSLIIGALSVAGAACSGSVPTVAPTGPGNSPPPNGSVVDVTIRDFVFSPANVTIKTGMTVRWTNVGPSAHTTTSDTGVWDSKVLSASNGTFSFTFMQAGTFGYHCTIHPPSAFPGFVGTVTVTP